MERSAEQTSAPDAREGVATNGVRPRGSERAISMLTAAGVVGVAQIVFASSFAALIFSGRLAAHVGRGVGLNLATTVVILAVLAWRGGRRGVVGAIQDGPAAILAIVAGTATAGMVGASDEAFFTVVALLAITTLVTGGVFLGLGASRLGNVARFVPYPVVGGFLAGTGWLLFSGGVEAATRISPHLTTVGNLFTADALVRWLPAFAFAVVLVAITRTVDRPLVIPAAFVAFLGLFAIGLLVTGTSISEAQDAGWLLGPFPSGRFVEAWAVHAVTQADWIEVLRQAGGIATAVFVGVIAFLLNVSATELTLGRDLDSNEELRTAGLANVLGAGIGGSPGFHTLGEIALVDRMRADARVVGLLAAGFVLVVLAFGADLVALMPRMLLAGTLMFLGLGFLVEWVIDARRKMPVIEYAIILAILATIVAWGLLPGVAAGLVLAVLLFAVSYSRTDLIRQSVPGNAYRSNVDRPPAEQTLLRELGGSLHVMRLQGFLFFGTANALFETIRERAWNADMPHLRFLVLDFRRVTGVDSSAALAFRKAMRLADQRGFELILTSAPSHVRGPLERSGVVEGEGPVRFMPDIDRGVQRAEDVLLADAVGGTAARVDEVWASLGSNADGLSKRLEPYLERLEIPAGDVLIRQGEPAEDLFVLERGELTVQFESEQGERIRVRTVAPGAVVGEVAVYAETPRTASVVADRPSTVLRLSRQAFERIEREQPELASTLHRWFAKLLALRLADTMRSVDALLR